MGEYSCQACGGVTEPGCAEGMGPPCKDDKVSRYNAATHTCDPLVPAGQYGEKCGTDPRNPCRFSLKCLAPDAAKPEEKLCLCDESAQWQQCGESSVCAPAPKPPGPLPPDPLLPGPSGKFTNACTPAQLKEGGSLCAPNFFYCYNGANGCNKSQSYFEKLESCKHFCQRVD